MSESASDETPRQAMVKYLIRITPTSSWLFVRLANLRAAPLLFVAWIALAAPIFSADIYSTALSDDVPSETERAIDDLWWRSLEPTPPPPPWAVALLTTIATPPSPIVQILFPIGKNEDKFIVQSASVSAENVIWEVVENLDRLSKGGRRAILYIRYPMASGRYDVIGERLLELQRALQITVITRHPRSTGPYRVDLYATVEGCNVHACVGEDTCPELRKALTDLFHPQ